MSKIDGASESNKYKRRNHLYLLLFIVILLSLGRIIYSFVCLKEDYHSDEIWSFGLSNSYFEPFIYQSSDHNILINFNEWIDSKVMKDYLTVDRTQRFTYDSVYFNQVHDYHPPFYYYILHTICSMFPEKFSPWYGFVINISAYIITIIFFYKLLWLLSRNEVIALVGCAFYGFSMGTLNNFVFIRMYSLVTMFSVILIYLHSRMLHDSKTIVPIFLITVLGCLTHHFYIPFAGCMALCFCIYYLIKKKFKILMIYAVTMLSAVGASLLLFPETIDHLFSGRINDAKFPFAWQFTMCWDCVLSATLGINIPNGSGFSYVAVLIIIVSLVLIFSPLLFLFRNEKWLKAFVLLLKKFLNNLVNKIKKADIVIVSMLVSSFGIILLTSLTVSLMHMGSNTDRYLFIIYPCISASFTLFVSAITSFVKKHGRICFALICTFFCALSNIFGTPNYFFQKPDQVLSLQVLLNDVNCVYIEDEPFLMTCFSRVAMDSVYFYATKSNDLEKKIIELSDPPENNKSLFYVIDSRSFYKEKANGEYSDDDFYSKIDRKDRSKNIKKEDFEDTLRKKYNKCEYLGFDMLFERRYEIYRVK